MRDANIELYRGAVDPADVPKRFCGLSRRHTCAILDKLPKSLRDDENSLALRRAANALAAVTERSVYTDYELQQALRVFDTRTMSAADCFKEFGVPAQSLRD
jgi:hypothetical protein